MEEGNRVLIALSGGEDSLVLLHFLSEWRYYYNQKLDLYAIHLDLGFPKEESLYQEGVEYLKSFTLERGIEFLFEKIDIGPMVLEASDSGKASPCFICSWHRRKALFKLAERLEIHKIAFGHHQDDVITTFFLNMFYCGELSTILPKQEMFSGSLYLIRPLYFVEKDIISRFVKKMNFKILENPCPFAGETKRAFWSNFLKEKIFSLDPIIKKNLFSALFNPRLDYLPPQPKRYKT